MLVHFSSLQFTMVLRDYGHYVAPALLADKPRLRAWSRELSTNDRMERPNSANDKSRPRFRQRLGKLTVLAKESLVPLLKRVEAALDLRRDLGL